jgi:hypothetical protein
MLPSFKIKMVAYYVKNKKCFRRHLELSRHFDFLARQHCFYFCISLELQHIKNGEHFIKRLCYNKILNYFEKYYLSY